MGKHEAGRKVTFLGLAKECDISKAYINIKINKIEVNLPTYSLIRLSF